MWGTSTDSDVQEEIYYAKIEDKIVKRINHSEPIASINPNSLSNKRDYCLTTFLITIKFKQLQY